MEIDPAILAVFGPPPAGINLAATQETAIIVVALVSTGFATVALGLRIWARNFQRFGMMADDWLMVVALVGHSDFRRRRKALTVLDLYLWHARYHYSGSQSWRWYTHLGSASVRGITDL